jgi:hydroxymethylpyrimidine/phosphomethylpyrimidine kinase
LPLVKVLSTLFSPAQRSLLTIAGHDPSSGAGISADLQTFASHGFFGTSVLTAQTVQSTQGVAEVQAADPAFLRRALDHLTADLPPAGIKIGMLGTEQIAAAVAAFLSSWKQGNAARQDLPVVFDPVLRSTSGATLLVTEALEVLHRQLIPAVSWITPNWPELSVLTGQAVLTLSQAERATHALAKRHPHLQIVATGGDDAVPTDILRLVNGEIHRFAGVHIDSTSTHGTGCAFSSALLSLLVLQKNPTDAVRGAKDFVAEAIRSAPGIGHGQGPLHLLWPLG